jgi:hypothetical protein
MGMLSGTVVGTPREGKAEGRAAIETAVRRPGPPANGPRSRRPGRRSDGLGAGGRPAGRTGNQTKRRADGRVYAWRTTQGTTDWGPLGR